MAKRLNDIFLPKYSIALRFLQCASAVRLTLSTFDGMIIVSIGEFWKTPYWSVLIFESEGISTFLRHLQQ